MPTTLNLLYYGEANTTWDKTEEAFIKHLVFAKHLSMSHGEEIAPVILEHLLQKLKVCKFF